MLFLNIYFKKRYRLIFISIITILDIYVYFTKLNFVLETTNKSYLYCRYIKRER